MTNRLSWMGRLTVAGALAALAGCGGGAAPAPQEPEDEGSPAQQPTQQPVERDGGVVSDGGVQPEDGGFDPYDPTESRGTQPLFDLDAGLTGRGGFFRVPWPSDLRNTPAGTVDVAGFPVAPGVDRVQAFKDEAKALRGYSTLPVVYFQFSGRLKAREPRTVLSGKDAPVNIIELPASAEEAPRLIPAIAHTLPADNYTPEFVLAVAPRPGFVLTAGRRHAVVVRRGALDVGGKLLAVHPIFQAIVRGQRPSGPRGAELLEHYAPLVAALDALGINRRELAVATMFTTGDRVSELNELSERLRQRHSVDIADISFDPAERYNQVGFCLFNARVALPQFQKGTPPFDRDGLFVVGPDGLPVVQRQETALMTLALPRRAMPAGGFPLAMFFHGSGGRARYGIDGWSSNATVEEVRARPGHLLATQGVAMASASLPISPDRVPGASANAYLNLNNPIAMRDNFRQGVIESRWILDALARVRIPPEAAASCQGISLPAGETAYRFATDRVSVQGQSMGGMYVNLLGPVEPRVRAVVPTGAGGYWTYFAFDTPKIPAAGFLIGLTVGAGSSIDWTHPSMTLLELVWEVVDPLASVPRLSARPLEGHAPRDVYQPVGDRDGYFSRAVFEAMTLGYGHQLAGPPAWPEVLDALRLAGLDTPAVYPVADNRPSSSGGRFTGASVQEPSSGDDGHFIWLEKPHIRQQYRCFHASYHATGKAVIVPPAPDTAPCP